MLLKKSLRRVKERWPLQAIAASGALVHKPYQTFYVLDRCKEELLSGPWYSAQPQRTKANLIAQFREESLYLVSSAPHRGKLRRLTELPHISRTSSYQLIFSVR